MSTPAQAARDARRELARLARPLGTFDAGRYFRDTGGLRFHNVGTDRVRAMARAIAVAHRDVWTVHDALAFADILVRDRYLEVKGVGIEVLARYRRQFTPAMLATWKRWLARGDSSNWATTDTICSMLIGPLLVANPRLATTVGGWAGDSSLWVRRASIVGLIPLARKELALDTLYATAKKLHGDPADLIQKAVGWALREAGKADMRRLETYLRTNGRRMPRTTVRYALERFPAARRRELLGATRPPAATSSVKPLRRP